MRVVDKIRRKMNDAFRLRLPEAFKEKFKKEISTEFNFIEMALVSRLKNGKLNKKEIEWIRAYSEGYENAMKESHD